MDEVDALRDGELTEETRESSNASKMHGHSLSPVSDDSEADHRRYSCPDVICSFITRSLRGLVAMLRPRRERTKFICIETQPHQPSDLASQRSLTRSDENAEIDTSESFCECTRTHPFPEELISRLAITEPGELGDCNHYLVISYRRQEKDPSQPKYHVSRKRGDRENNAPKKVLDRAIAFAAFHNIHLIWIDQECIGQDDRTDKECGIQSMDLIYE